MTRVKFKIIGVHERDDIIAKMKENCPNASVFYDEVRSKNCLARTIKVLKESDNNEYTHIAVLCDDLELCNQFEEIVTTMCEVFPNVIFSPYNSRLQYTDRKTSSPYVRVNGCGVYGQCVIIPVSLIDKFLSWAEKHCPENYPHDDVAVGEFAYQTGVPVFATIPCILQHIEPCNSILKYNSPNKTSKVYNGQIAPSAENWLDKNYSISKVIRNSKGMVDKLI